jgi:signal transduction histidine kinase
LGFSEWQGAVTYVQSKFKSISFKLGILFSGIFIVLLLSLGFILYGVFTNVFVDYIKQDVLARGNNHARILGENFDATSVNHVIEMEKGVTTEVLISDKSQEIIAASKPPDQDMKKHLTAKASEKGRILEADWQKHKYIISVTPIGNDQGYVYMYYPSTILREIVFVMTVLIVVASVGILLLAFGLIGILSRKLTSPLLIMKEATSKMALGKYKQKIPIEGEDEIAQLGYSIKELGEQLQYFEDSRNDFLAAVAHELRTPLTYIKGYSDVLSKGMIDKPEEQVQYLTIINKESQRLSVLVNDLFEMSKLQAGRFELNRQQANINEMIERTASSLKPAAEMKGLSLNLDLYAGLPPAEVDVHRMEQVFYNLIENGIKYTSAGEISIRSFSKDEYAVVEISDSGEGIPEVDLPRIFERFYRVDRSRTRKTGGTGLGLYVVKQIIEAHHGTIRVQSTLNQGSVFTIYLKIANRRI